MIDDINKLHIQFCKQKKKKKKIKDTFTYVLTNIEGALKNTQRSTAITPTSKLADTLKFLAQCGYQHQIGQDRHLAISQQSMSNCQFEVLNVIENITLFQTHSVKSNRRKIERGQKILL